jgi:hypothetical protein
MTGEIADQSAECKLMAPDEFLEGTASLRHRLLSFESLSPPRLPIDNVADPMSVMAPRQ